MSVCRSCGAPILWTVSAVSGKRMPVDAAPSDVGNITIVDGLAYVAGPGDLPAEIDVTAGPFYTSHFATCPDAKEWRK